jgi:3'(2'), 5'-bisphosphate nucleotidase
LTFSRASLDTLCDIAIQAGQAIMSVYQTDFDSWSKADASPLTQADLRADASIRQGLEAAFKGVFILSEESTTPGGGVPSRFFLVDPLDGTREFLKRNDEFTVNIALIEAGCPVAGVVLAPALDELFFAAAGLGAWRRGPAGDIALRTTTYAAGEPLRVIGSRSHGSEALAAWLAALPGAHAFMAAGSSLKFCRIAEGRADIYPRFGQTGQWDTAAGQCVLEQAGGQVIDFEGAALRYGLDRPLINPEFMAMGPGLPDLRPGRGGTFQKVTT